MSAGVRLLLVVLDAVTEVTAGHLDDGVAAVLETLV